MDVLLAGPGAICATPPLCTSTPAATQHAATPINMPTFGSVSCIFSVHRVSASNVTAFVLSAACSPTRDGKRCSRYHT